jgi:hypothetical protein
MCLILYDVDIEIMNYLNIVDFCMLSQVNKYWNCIISNNITYKKYMKYGRANYSILTYQDNRNYKIYPYKKEECRYLTIFEKACINNDYEIVNEILKNSNNSIILTYELTHNIFTQVRIKGYLEITKLLFNYIDNYIYFYYDEESYFKNIYEILTYNIHEIYKCKQRNILLWICEIIGIIDSDNTETHNRFTNKYLLDSALGYNSDRYAQPDDSEYNYSVPTTHSDFSMQINIY